MRRTRGWWRRRSRCLGRRTFVCWRTRDECLDRFRIVAICRQLSARCPQYVRRCPGAGRPSSRRSAAYLLGSPRNSASWRATDILGHLQHRAVRIVCPAFGDVGDASWGPWRWRDGIRCSARLPRWAARRRLALTGLARLDVRDREVDSSQAASWRVSLYAIRARNGHRARTRDHGVVFRARLTRPFRRTERADPPCAVRRARCPAPARMPGPKSVRDRGPQPLKLRHAPSVPSPAADRPSRPIGMRCRSAITFLAKPTGFAAQAVPDANRRFVAEAMAGVRVPVS